MKKNIVFILIVILTPILAGVYGMLHDQFTYTISPEYYTKFKFIQFHIQADDETKYRSQVAIVGFLATWWTGIFIGIAHGLTGLIHKNHKTMLKVVSKAILLTLLIAALTGLVGLAYGRLYLAKTGVDWWLPDNLIDKESFIAVGSMHNFSYLGGLIGLVAGIIYQVRQKRKMRQIRQDQISKS